MSKARRNLSGPLMLRSAVTLGPDGKAPSEFRLLASGENPTDRGFAIMFDEIAVAMVQEAYRVDGKERLYADWNHGMIPKDESDRLSRDAGASCASFVPEIRNGELWVTDLRWTEDGRTDVESHRYNLFSPAMAFDDTQPDGYVRPRRLINFALVNDAGLRNIEPLIAASAAATPSKETEMEYEKLYAEEKAKREAAETKVITLSAKVESLETEAAKLRPVAGDIIALGAAFGLPKTATGDDVQTSVKSVIALRAEVLKVTGEETNEGAVVAIRTMKDQAAKVVTLEAQIETERVTALRAELDGVWEGAIKEGRLPPADVKDEEESLTGLTGGKVTKDVIAAARKRVLKMSAKVVTDGARQPPAGGTPSGEKVITLSAEETAVLKANGRNLEVALRAKKHIAEQDAARVAQANG